MGQIKLPVIVWVLLATALRALAESPDAVAAYAINSLGIDLLRQTAPTNGNALVSPYSIQMGMAMLCAGAAGQTRDQMVRVLHYPKDQGQINAAFSALQTDLDGVVQHQVARAEYMKQYGVTNEPLTLTTANRLFAQSGFDFRPSYLGLMNDTYHAPLENLDFIHDAPGGRAHINSWVAEQTHDRIRDLIPAGALGSATRLVLVNAIYLKAAWDTQFAARATQPRPFYIATGAAEPVPTMFLTRFLRYARRDRYSVVTIPYAAGDLQFVIFLPTATNGLAALEAKLTPEMLADCADLSEQEVSLFLPKFKLEPPEMFLANAFQSLGMNSAFNIPGGSANFDRMAPRRPGDYLYISEVIHKTFLKLDESGTEAAAATAVVMLGSASPREPTAEPPKIRVDHPFLFAIQHRASGACLFLGHVTDPR